MPHFLYFNKLKSLTIALKNNSFYDNPSLSDNKREKTKRTVKIPGRNTLLKK